MSETVAMKDSRRAYLFAGLSIFFWSTVATAFKLTLRVIDATDLLLVSAVASAAVLFGVLAWRGSLRTLAAWPVRQFVRSALLGMLNPFLYYLVLFEAYTRLPAQEAQPLNYTWPIVLSIFSAVFLRQRLRPVMLLALLVSFSGVYVISTRGEVFAARFSDPLGVGLAMGSSLIWATYWILTMRDDRDPATRLFVNTVFGCIFIIAYTFVIRPFHSLPAAGIAGGAYVGCFEMGITFLLWLRALQTAPSTAAISTLVYVSPFVSLIHIHFILGEAIAVSTITGLALIVGGIVMQQIAHLRPSPAPVPARRRPAGD